MTDPPWMTSNINDKINYNNNINREYLKKGKQQVGYIKLQNIIKELSELISTKKDDCNRHVVNKLTDLTTSSKTYWSILKTSLHANCHHKITYNCNLNLMIVYPPLNEHIV